MGRITEAVKHIIIINVILFAAGPLMGLNLQEWLALYFPKNEHFGIWQFVSHMFMHGGFAHILFNMYALWAFGTPLEQMWGRNKFLFFYFSAGIGAGLIYTAVNYYQFNNTYQDLIQLGMNAESIQQILNTGQYNSEILTAIPEKKISEFSRSTTLLLWEPRGQYMGYSLPLECHTLTQNWPLSFFRYPLRQNTSFRF